MTLDSHEDRDRLLAAARSLGLDVDGLEGAPLAAVAQTVHRLALARLDHVDTQIDALAEERALAAAALWTRHDADV